MKIGRILFDLKIPRVEGKRTAPVSPTARGSVVVAPFCPVCNYYKISDESCVQNMQKDVENMVLSLAFVHKSR